MGEEDDPSPKRRRIAADEWFADADADCAVATEVGAAAGVVVDGADGDAVVAAAEAATDGPDGYAAEVVEVLRRLRNPPDWEHESYSGSESAIDEADHDDDDHDDDDHVEPVEHGTNPPNPQDDDDDDDASHDSTGSLAPMSNPQNATSDMSEPTECECGPPSGLEGSGSD